MKAAIVDMQIGAGTSPMSSYVAFTRVKKKEDLLIYRSFDRELFTKGSLEGPELLLKVLRGEQVDWEAIEAARSVPEFDFLAYAEQAQDLLPSSPGPPVAGYRASPPTGPLTAPQRVG